MKSVEVVPPEPLNRESLRSIAIQTLEPYHKKVLFFFESLGERYAKVYLYNMDFTDDKLSTDPYLAMEFFIRHSFYRGRRQELSSRYVNDVLRVLDEYELKNAPIESLLEDKFLSRIKEIKISKKDIEHLESLFSELRKLKNEGYNFYNYIRNLVKAGELEKVYKELKGIKEVGDKIASFILRDVILISQIRKNIDRKEVPYIFPVDTHVRKVIKDYLALSSEEKLFDYIEGLQKNDTLSVSRIAAGMWYSYYHSFELLLENFLLSESHPNLSLSFSST
ncbi:MAG: hypothetical protein ACK42C_01495 [Aquificaceae bacterium]|uniref:hypothetical protein n=1 Tax=Hydrogenobacter sp. Uz 6-8 TaxID=3384828 RepID=UPI0030A329FD